MTTNCRFSKSLNHLVWCGRIAEWSMSGLVMATWPALRTTLRRWPGRVAVVGVRLERDLGGLGQRPQLDQLVGRQRLGGEQVERPRRIVARDGVDDRQVVAERLARCGGRDDADVAAGADRLDGLRLVRVQRLHAAAAQRGDEPRIEALRPGRVAWRLRLVDPVRGDQPANGRVAKQRADGVVHRARPIEEQSGPPGQLERMFYSR